ncbi:hypothetical protein Acr_03g0014140 [Actinidia rufa]|uniref:Uncharacterized protein n=1 Tax=Actinidia rufa TaxID=165716 RepID=A0A7J0EE42_9ERIC|nr:hypothetical protein Acr_03g0014140 [Actinidia rufa]
MEGVVYCYACYTRRCARPRRQDGDLRRVSVTHAFSFGAGSGFPDLFQDQTSEEFQALVVGLAITEVFLGGTFGLWFSQIQVFWAMKQIPDLLLLI